jgi:peptidoglycan/LPS O-acetylase OafA/YrhL
MAPRSVSPLPAVAFEAASKRTRFSRGFSLYLDVMRVSAALAVVLYHASFQASGGDWLHPGSIGPDAVTVFFVLSGLVISYAVDTKESSPRLYFSSRLARLWSVLMPALALTYLINRFGVRMNPAPNWFAPDGSAWQLLPSALFVNELWFHPVIPLSDIPVWSIGFEFWYYVLFGVIIFAPGKWRYIAVSVVALIAGPRILLLLPIWLLGVAVYQLGRRRLVGGTVAWVCFVLPPLIIGSMVLTHWNKALIAAGAKLVGEDGSLGHWIWCENVLWAYLVGFLSAVHFYGAWCLHDRVEHVLVRFRNIIEFTAGLTLSIYLFHFPLMVLASAELDKWPHGPVRSIVAIVATLICCAVLGLLFERQRYPLRSLIMRATRPLAGAGAVP